MTAFWQDWCYYARMLLRQPIFTLAAILTLALEIGTNIIRLVVIKGLALGGVGIGIAGAFVLTRLLSSLLFESTVDPATFAVVSLLLIGVALMACYLLARRAMKVDPMAALKYE